MDFYNIKHKLKLHNYNLYKLTNNKFCITKNEHGTYDEFYDFAINIEIDITTEIILHWDIIQNNKNITNIFIKDNTTLSNLCDYLCNKK